MPSVLSIIQGSIGDMVFAFFGARNFYPYFLESVKKTFAECPCFSVLSVLLFCTEIVHGEVCRLPLELFLEDRIGESIKNEGVKARSPTRRSSWIRAMHSAPKMAERSFI